MTKLSIAAIVALMVAGCASSPPRQVSAPAPETPRTKQINRDGSTLILPDGTRVGTDASGGFRLPNGDQVTRDRTGALVLPTGARCVPNPAGYSCP